MKRLVALIISLFVLSLAVPAEARRHSGGSHRGHAASHGGGHRSSHAARHHGGKRHAGSRHGSRSRGHRGRGHRGHPRQHAPGVAAAPAGPAMSQDDAAQLALGAVPGNITNATKTMRGSETFYSFDIAAADGAHRVLVDASRRKVMASIPLSQ